MDKLVRIFAPRGGVDYTLKSLALLVLLGAGNWLRDWFEHGAAADDFLNNLREASVVGFLPTLLAMALIGHLNSLQKQLEQAAITDPLTGLPNRRGFFDAASAVLPDPGGVLLMLDADHFKRVNDTYGHGAGDRCLIMIASLLRQQLRSGDIVARLGGEEFGLFLVRARHADADAIGARLVKGVSLNLDGTSETQTVTMSIGAVCTTGQTDIAQLLSIADEALYKAKEAGRARMVFADTDGNQHKHTVIGPRQVA